MIIDYDFDKMVEFGTETIDENKEVVNPPYRQINHKLKKAQLAETLNHTETIFPGSDLKLIFKISALSNCER